MNVYKFPPTPPPLSSETGPIILGNQMLQTVEANEVSLMKIGHLSRVITNEHPLQIQQKHALTS